MKRLLLALFLVLSMAIAASAAEVQFSKFKVTVPNGWTSSEDGDTVALLAPGNAAAISIVATEAENKTAAALAKEVARELKGTTPQPADGGYTFTFKNKNGVESKSVLFVENNELVMITITGSHPQIGEIIASIRE